MWSHAYIAIGQYQQLVPRFAREPRQLVDFAVCAEMLGPHQQTDFALGKIRDDPPDQLHGGVGVAVDGEQDFVLRIILQAKTGEIFVRCKVDAKHWFQHANAWSETWQDLCARAPEEPQRR